jgi:acetyl/propionyl-CoA carboxylase alpha subunit
VKYIVRIGERDVEVALDGDRVLVNGEPTAARLAETAGTALRMLSLGDRVHRLLVRPGKRRGEYTLWLDGHRFDVDALDERTRAIRSLAAMKSGPTGPAPLVAPMPGMVVKVNVQEGDSIQAGQGLVVMEAMKMENELRASGGGTVKRVLVAPGTAVEKGALLLELE